MKRTLALLTALLFGPLAALHADEPAKLPAKEKFHLYLLVGQSNMAGRGKVEAQDKKTHSRVLTLNKANRWVPAVDPLYFDKSAAGVSLGKSFGEILADANPDVTVGLIPRAVGGSPIDVWNPEAYYKPTNSHPRDGARKRAKLALEAGELNGIPWHQGESDATPDLSKTYEGKLHDLIQGLRRELKAPEVPPLAGQTVEVRRSAVERCPQTGGQGPS